MTKRILCLWLPNWPIQRRLQARSAHDGHAPLALYESSARGGERITHVSDAAAKLGAQPGLTLADAAARWRRQIAYQQGDPTGDRETLVELARRFGHLSPLIGIEEGERPESILLDLAGVAALFGGEQKLAQSALQVIAAQRLAARLTVADSIGAAWAAAHFGDDRAGPILVPPGESAHFLAPLPVQALRLSPVTLELLREFGLETVGELLALPRASLTSRLGEEPLARLDQALGKRAETITPIDALAEFVAQWDYEHPTEQADAIDAAVQHLCNELADQLARAGRGAEQVRCTLRCESSPAVAYQVGFFEPTASAEQFCELLHLRFEGSHFSTAVAGICLETTASSPLAPRQRELFADHARSHQRQLAQWINRVAGRLGRQAVVRPFPRAEAQPELAWREAPLLDCQTRPRQTSSRPRPGGLLQRPTFLFREPISIAVTAVVPDGPPARFDYQSKSYIVARHVGPERIETGWWRQRGVRRDYYRVQTDAGRQFWIFRSLRSGRWYLHGEFA